MRLLRALRAGTLAGFLLAAPLVAVEPEPLAAALERTGLSGVRAASGGALFGRLAGETDREIVLSARCGKSTNACDLLLTAVADLARTPLRHRLVVVLLREDGEVPRPADLSLAPADRALVHLHVGRPAGARPLIEILPDRGRGPKAVTPGWVVHALLRAGDAAGSPLRVGAPGFPWLGQLVLRTTRLQEDVAPEWGIPAAAFSAPQVERGSAVLATAVRRLDRLEGRPIPEDRYLALFGRVWLRRDLYWLGLLLWALLVFRAGRRRTAGEEALRRRPAFLFRALLLIAILAAPVFSTLLVPAAALALLPPLRRSGGWIVRAGLALFPSLLFLSALVLAFAGGAATGLRPPGPAGLLIPATLASFLWMAFGEQRRG